MSFPPFHKIIEKEFQNFEASKSNFPDIYAWSERVKGILMIKNVKNYPAPDEFFWMINLISNAYINSILLTMKCYIFHAFAIARLGVETFLNIAIIQADFDKHYDIWKNYNKTKKDTVEFEKAKKEYNKTFRFNKQKHNYSSFMSSEEKDEIFSRWDILSTVGSHVSFTQSVYSFKVEAGSNDLKFQSGFFDAGFDDKKTLATHLVWIIDTYLIVAKNLSKILENHSIFLEMPHSKILELHKDWFDFKAIKIKEYGIKIK